VTADEKYMGGLLNTPPSDQRHLRWGRINLRNFLAELKRRHVYRVAIAYGVVAWLLIQVATQVFPFFEIPNWVVRLVVMVTLLGFPIALIIAWAFEMTPEGLKRADAVSPNEYVPRWSTRRFVALIISVAILGAAVPLVHLSRSKPSFLSRVTVTSTPPQKSIAVLPLLNENGDPSDEYFSDGLSEEVIAALAQIKGLKVIGRSSSFRFKGHKEDSKSIGETLGVSTLLEGTVRKNGSRVRIVAELVNAADGSELWSQTFDRELKDIFAVQAEIAKAVATSLELTLLGTEDDAAKNVATKSVEAHNAYLQGHFYFERRDFEGYLKAVSFFDQAIRIDPGYALAYVERSEAWTWIGDLSGDQQKEAWSKAAHDGEKAVSIEPKLAEAHAALGWARFFAEWRFDEGLAELRHAQQLAPWNPSTIDLLAPVVVYLGEFEEAEKLARQAIEHEPLAYQARQSLARLLFVQGKLDEAEAAARKAVELQPTAAGSHRWQVFVAIERGDGETALREARLEPNERYQRFELALAHYARGDRPAADAALAELIARDRDVMAYQVSEVYAWRGEKDKAFEWLQISLDNHDTGTLSLLIDPLLRDLHNDPRYEALVARIGLPPQHDQILLHATPKEGVTANSEVAPQNPANAQWLLTKPRRNVSARK
jgi:TolB-like protein